MKTIIKENKLYRIIDKYLDNYFNGNEINWTYGMGEDENGYLDIDIENENFLIFYKGDWQGEEDSDIIFHYFEEDYYGYSPAEKPFRDKAPILEVIGEYGKHLDDLFGTNWMEPMKEWFKFYFKLPVKTITTYY